MIPAKQVMATPTALQVSANTPRPAKVNATPAGGSPRLVSPAPIRQPATLHPSSVKIVILVILHPPHTP